MPRLLKLFFVCINRLQRDGCGVAIPSAISFTPGGNYYSPKKSRRFPQKNTPPNTKLGDLRHLPPTSRRLPVKNGRCTKFWRTSARPARARPRFRRRQLPLQHRTIYRHPRLLLDRPSAAAEVCASRCRPPSLRRSRFLARSPTTAWNTFTILTAPSGIGRVLKPHRRAVTSVSRILAIATLACPAATTLIRSFLRRQNSPPPSRAPPASPMSIPARCSLHFRISIATTAVSDPGVFFWSATVPKCRSISTPISRACMDRLFRTRLSVYGWALYFGSFSVPIDTNVWS